MAISTQYLGLLVATPTVLARNFTLGNTWREWTVKGDGLVVVERTTYGQNDGWVYKLMVNGKGGDFQTPMRYAGGLGYMGVDVRAGDRVTLGKWAGTDPDVSIRRVMFLPGATVY